MMSEAWSQWEGQVIDGRFLLKQHLGGSRTCAVFLTEVCPRDRGSSPDRSATAAPSAIPLAIKLIAADEAEAARQLSRWRLAQILSHPHLIRVFDAGRCRLGDTDLIFGVLEYADENLAQIIPQRPLTQDEARAVLAPAVDALDYLHEQGLVHGRLKLANVMAMGDDLKLSSDWIAPANRVAPDSQTPSVYDAPETAQGLYSSASDIWSLGVVMTEALTQRPPSGNGPQSEPALPDNLPAAFVEVVRGCLRRDPKLRLTADGIASWLHGGSPKQARAAAVVVPLESTPSRTTQAPKKAAASVEKPLSRPAVAAAASAKSSQIAAAATTATLPAKRRESPAGPKPSGSPARRNLAQDWLVNFVGWIGPLLRRFALPAMVAVAALVALYAGLGLLHRDSGTASRTDTPAAPQPPSSQPKPSAKAQPASLRTPAKPSARVPATGGDDRSRSATSTSAGSAGDSQGVVQQVLPHPSQAALDTIQGTIKVSVRVDVDGSGNVAGAALASPGPSAYFARLSLEAAKGWKFNPGSAHPMVLHFEFRNSGARAYAGQ